MLRGHAEVHEVALSDKPGRAIFHVPLADDGTVLHLAGNLKNTHTQFKDEQCYEVEVRTLDEFSFNNVRFIKIDVEGSERDVLAGARETIRRDRPALLLELLSGTYQDPGRETDEICTEFGYDAVIVQRGKRLPALPTIAALGKNTTWGTDIETRNVLFLSR
jgi:hypothetical protein